MIVLNVVVTLKASCYILVRLIDVEELSRLVDQLLAAILHVPRPPTVFPAIQHAPRNEAECRCQRYSRDNSRREGGLDEEKEDEGNEEADHGPH